MTKTTNYSAGLLMFRKSNEIVQVFLVHPGGPYFLRKDEGSWTIPKGEYLADEEPLAAAQREFNEETGFESLNPFTELGRVVQKSGKVVLAWAFEGNCDPASLISNTCEIEWPPRSKKRIVIPEIDRGAWFVLDHAEVYIRKEQRPFLNRLRINLQAS